MPRPQLLVAREKTVASMVSEGQYDEAQRVKEKAYEMCINAGIYFG